MFRPFPVYPVLLLVSQFYSYDCFCFPLLSHPGFPEFSPCRMFAYISHPSPLLDWSTQPHSPPLHITALHCTALHFTAFKITVHCTAYNFTALHSN